jgi:hypothetical protein
MKTPEQIRSEAIHEKNKLAAGKIFRTCMVEVIMICTYVRRCKPSHPDYLYLLSCIVFVDETSSLVGFQSVDETHILV